MYSISARIPNNDGDICGIQLTTDVEHKQHQDKICHTTQHAGQAGTEEICDERGVIQTLKNV